MARSPRSGTAKAVVLSPSSSPSSGETKEPLPSSGAAASKDHTRRTFNGLKVFSATMVADRERLGDRVTDWIAAHPDLEIVEIVQTQSSDENFHCIALTVFYFEPIRAR